MKRRVRNLTIREAAALLAIALLAACGGGGGGTFSPLAPGVSGGSPATPALALAVAPASTTLALPGSTAQVVATISSGAAGVTVAYTGGCANVATISPASQVTVSGGSTPAFTETALVPSASCTARFAAAGAVAATVATVGNATPPPTPSPTPSPIPTVAPTAPPTVAPTLAPTPKPPPTPIPTVGPLVVTPLSILVGNAYPATSTTATIAASRANFVGAFTESDNCSPAGGPTVSVTPTSATSWLVTWTPLTTNMATASAFCQATITAGTASAVVQIAVSATGVVIQ